MKIIINDANYNIPNRTLDITNCESTDDLELVSLIMQLLEMDEIYKERHNGYRARTVTDMVEHIND